MARSFSSSARAGREALRRVLGHQLVNEARETLRCIGPQLARIGHRSGQVRRDLGAAAPAGIGRLSRHQFERDTAEAVEIGTAVDVGIAAGLLGTQVVERADHHPGLGQALLPG